MAIDEDILGPQELVRLFSVLSHDLKSPIFSIDGFSELLIGDYNDRLDEEGQDFLRRIRGSAQQMKRVLDEMALIVKLLSRPTAHKTTSLQELIEEVLLKYNFMIDEGGVQISIAPELPTVNVDPEKLRAGVGALVSNALFFNDRPRGEREVTIDCVSNGSQHRLSIKDNGIGIDPRYTHQIFDLGLKLDKSRGGGPGYGLYLARCVAEAHGGAVTVDTELDQGATFTMTFSA